MGYLYEACDQIPDLCHQPSTVAENNATKNEHLCSICIQINKVGKQEVGIWWIQKHFPRYGVPIWSVWPYFSIVRYCHQKFCISNFIVIITPLTEGGGGMLFYFCPSVRPSDKNQLSRQTGSRILTGPKTLPTIWYTYMTRVTKYQISAINSYWEKWYTLYSWKFLVISYV
jgi:hypothetical protein